MFRMITGLVLWLLGLIFVVLADVLDPGISVGLISVCAIAGAILIVRGAIQQKRKAQRAYAEVCERKSEDERKSEERTVRETYKHKFEERTEFEIEVYDAFRAMNWSPDTSLEEIYKVSSHFRLLLDMRGIVASHARYLFKYNGIYGIYYFYIPTTNEYFFITFEWNRRSSYMTFVEKTEKNSILETLRKIKPDEYSARVGLSAEEIERLIKYIETLP